MKENKYKLLVIDIDGTLLDRNNNVSETDIEALAKAGKAGVPVSLSTGRVVQASMRFIDLMALNGYHMFFDGALVYSPEKDEEVYVETIGPEIVRQMIDYSREIGLDFDLYSSTRFFAERETRATDIRRDFFRITATIVDFEDIWRTERIIKGTLVVATEEEKAKAAEFVRRFKGVLRFSWSNTPAYPDTDFINIISPESSKGKALEELASFLGIDLKDVMAIGDGANDIPLLSTAGFGIAMGNAPEKVKEAADYVTLDVDNNGIAAAVNKFLL